MSANPQFDPNANNPYQPPYQGSPGGPEQPVNRTPFVLAAVGAGLASLYWAALTLLIGLAAANGATSSAQVVLPFVLIALYAWRGLQVFKGDPSAASRLMWLHAVGGVVALLQLFSANPLVMALHSVKVVIHIFGGITSILALRAYRQSQGFVGQTF